MTDQFFALNQPNYARWFVIYLSNLIRLKQENSHLVTEFRRGAFGIRRIKANFARSPVELTLEQTINSDASNQLSNNLAADFVSARQKWALNHSMRTKILTAVKENVRLPQKDDTSYSLKKSRIKKDQNNLQSIISAIKNLNFLLNVKPEGNKQKSTFISECQSAIERFKKPISRNEILNFASQGTTKIQNSKGKQAVLKMERDIFGRLLAISLEKNRHRILSDISCSSNSTCSFLVYRLNVKNRQICIGQDIEI